MSNAVPSLPYDAILVLSFGGPDKPEDVIPFLENVLRGRNVPRERMLEVAEHYYHFGGKSPINGQNLALIDALRTDLATNGINLPIYWGNRNWHPLLTSTLQHMRGDGVRRAIAFVTSAFSSYSGCRQYREDIQRSQSEVGEGAPIVDKLRVFYNHPAFINVCARHLSAALDRVPATLRENAHVLFTAHSLPMSMASTSNYVVQLQESCSLVMKRLGREGHELAYQSRSGPPTQPWLEPDILDRLRGVHATHPGQAVVISPIGFLSDHMEVLFDLDTEASALCTELGIEMRRAATPGADPEFVAMIRDLIRERMDGTGERCAIGQYPANHDICPADCCPAPRRPAS